MDENPYLGIVGRRVRNLKKRLAKVTEWEKLVGTTLNAEQREAVASKSSIERSIADMDAIMEQMLVAAQEQASSATKCSAASAQVTSALTEEVVIAAAQKLSNMSIEPPLPVPVPVVENANASAKQTVSVGVSTFQTPSDERTSAISVPEPAHTEDLKQEMGELLMKLLRGLHVCARYTATTGKKLPDELDYFGEVVLGQTVTLGTDFTSNLAQSVRQAGFFLYPETSGDVMILTGTSYTALSSTVDMLAAELGDSSIAKKEKKGKKSQQKKGQKPHVVDANMEVTTPEQQLPDTEPTIAAVSPEELRVEASTGTGAVVAKDLSAVPVDKELKKRKAKPKSKKVATGEPELTTDIALAAQVGSEKNAQPSVLEPEGAEKNPKYDAPKMRAAPKEKKAVLVEPVVPVVTESAAAQAPKANKRRTEKKNTITAQDAHTLPAPIQAPPAAKVSQAQAPKKDKNESNTSNSSVKAAATENKNKVENKRSPKAKIAVVTESEITVEGDGFTTVVVGKARKQAVDGAPANVGKGQVKGHVR